MEVIQNLTKYCHASYYLESSRSQYAPTLKYPPPEGPSFNIEL